MNPHAKIVISQPIWSCEYIQPTFTHSPVKLDKSWANTTAMKGRNLKPSRVYQTATLLMETRGITQEPPWYKTIGSIPPSEVLTRTQPVQHQEPTRRQSRIRKPSKMFRPQPIEYEEDRLRKEFYSDHPWELARPRVVLENDGKDGQRYDWSSIQQRGKPLDGESVVRRQLWLMNSKNLGRNQAYDIARKEFYALRHEEEVERRVAREEALWVGAAFGKGALDVGIELEDKTYEKWKDWAVKEVEAISRQRDAAYSNISSVNEDEPIPELEEKLVEEQEPALA